MTTSTNICPFYTISEKEPTKCLKSKCSLWMKNVETSNPARKCAIAVLAEMSNK